jgi:hypothetical protein
MTTHGENVGSRKVEPETQNLPKWRLKANYLMRQLARIWYGKLLEHAYPKSSEFERLFVEIMCQFVKDHGGNGKEVLHRLESGKQAFELMHGMEITFKDRISELDWMIRNGIPKELREEFAKDELIQDIIRTAEWILKYEEAGENPPYEPTIWLKPLDYYEQLPVLGPLPGWKSVANHVERELARVWYGKTCIAPWHLSDYLVELFHSFVFNRGIKAKEFHITLSQARADFKEMHGCELSFRTPVQEIIWMAEKCLPESLSSEFLSDPQVTFILRAGELIWALLQADLKPPYEKYGLSFRPLEEYEEQPIPSDDQPSQKVCAPKH